MGYGAAGRFGPEQLISQIEGGWAKEAVPPLLDRIHPSWKEPRAVELEDPRIGGMYAGMVKQWFSGLFHRVWRRGLMRSGMVTVLLLLAVIVTLTVAYRAHMQGNFHRLKAKMATEEPEAPVLKPGGQEALTLMRTRMMGDSMPEFESVILLPGRGMNSLQIMAYVPGRGEVGLMASPTLEDATKVMTRTATDANGAESLAMGGAFEAPWAGRMWGAPADGHANVAWKAHTMELPGADGDGAVRGGLLLAKTSDAVSTTALPDGGDAQATFNMGDFGVRWPSKTQVTVTVLLSSRTIDLTMVARNTGDVAEPVGLGWRPRFAVPNTERAQWKLRIPGQSHVEVHNGGIPTGTLTPVVGTQYDFTQDTGVKLGRTSLDDCFAGLHQNLLDNGPVAELSDPEDNYGLRLTALSSTIKTMCVTAPADEDFVTIEPQFNYPDPFGREWSKEGDTGMVVLQPGQSAQWVVRLELISLANSVK